MSFPGINRKAWSPKIMVEIVVLALHNRDETGCIIFAVVSSRHVQ